MGDGKHNERASIRESGKSLKKYGSTSARATTSVNKLIKHFIESSDTLQGIALRYGVTMEQLRRLNRLWASDSLFLKEYLLVPIDDTPCTSSTARDYAGQNKPKGPSQARLGGDGGGASSKFEDPSVDEFLKKLDRSIAATKKNVKDIQVNSDLFNGEEIRDEDLNTYKKRPAQSRLKQSTIVTMTNLNQYSTSTFSNRGGYQQLVDTDEFAFPSNSNNNISSTSNKHVSSNGSTTSQKPVPLVVTQNGRKLKTSLQKMERQQDEIFEL